MLEIIIPFFYKSKRGILKRQKTLEYTMTIKKFFRQLLEGIAVGFAFVSGMGGGTVAVLIGIYDDLIDAVADLTKTPLQSIKKAWVWCIGLIIGVLALVWPLTKLLELYPFPTITFVAGLTLGGFRELTSVTKGNINKKNIFLLIIGIIVPVAFGIISWFTVKENGITIEKLDFVRVLILLGVGLMLAAAIVAPGISGTQFLISIGYLSALTIIVKNIFEGINVGLGIGVVAILLVSMIVGLVLVSKLMQVLLKKWYTGTYFVIFGFIIGSIFAGYFNGDIKGKYDVFVGNFDWVMLIVSIAGFVIAFLISYYLLKLAQNKTSVENALEIDTSYKEEE